MPLANRSRLFAPLCSLALVACGGEGSEESSRIEQPPVVQPTMTATAPIPPITVPTGSATSGPPPVSTGSGGGTALPPDPPPDQACGGCNDLGLLRCDPVSLQCVECLEAADCAYGSQQACVAGWCTNGDTSVTICPATRPVDDSSCGLSGYTCIYGTEGKYSCRCGLGAPIGGGTIEATIWMCDVLP